MFEELLTSLQQQTDVVLMVIVAVYGALLGSFANVVIYRMPLGESVITPRSHCRSCGKPVRWHHNIPIFSYIFLRGKCGNCHAPYSIRYPLVEALMAVLFAFAFYRFSWSWNLLESLILIFSLVCCAFIDLDHMILPDKFTLSGIVIGLIGSLINPDRNFLDAFLGVLFGGGFFWAIAYLYYLTRKQEGMGGGDIKLAAWLGAVLGWKAIPIIIVVSSLAGSLVGGIFAIRSKDRMKYAVPFGPFLVIAALAYLLFHGASWADWYLGLHGLVDEGLAPTPQ